MVEDFSFGFFVQQFQYFQECMGVFVLVFLFDRKGIIEVLIFFLGFLRFYEIMYEEEFCKLEGVLLCNRL